LDLCGLLLFRLFELLFKLFTEALLLLRGYKLLETLRAKRLLKRSEQRFGGVGNELFFFI